MYILMAIFSILLATKTSLLYNNFTYLTYTGNDRYLYILWVISISIFLLYKVVYLFKKITYLTKFDIILIIITFILMLAGSMLPYYPNLNNLSSSLHIILSMIASLFLLIIIKVLIQRSIFLNLELSKSIDIYYNWSILVLTTLMIMFGSINTIIELAYTGIVLTMLYLIEIKFVKKKQ